MNLDFINRVTKLLRMVTVTALLKKKLDLPLLNKSQILRRSSNLKKSFKNKRNIILINMC